MARSTLSTIPPASMTATTLAKLRLVPQPPAEPRESHWALSLGRRCLGFAATEREADALIAAFGVGTLAEELDGRFPTDVRAAAVAYEAELENTVLEGDPDEFRTELLDVFEPEPVRPALRLIRGGLSQ